MSIGFLLLNPARAQQRKAVSIQQQDQQNRALQNKIYDTETKYRLTAHMLFANSNPAGINSFRAGMLWNATTSTRGSVSNLTGFHVSAEYKINTDYIGLEFGKAEQILDNTPITGATYSVQDSADYEFLYLIYNRVNQKTDETSYEYGLGLGYATKFRFHNLFEGTGYKEDLGWQDNPVLLKVSGSYNHHFSHNVRARAGVAYEYAVSGNLKADANHSVTMNGSPISSGQSLQNSNGENITMDLSGIRLYAGLAVAF